jgi:hypothetical protein
VATVRRLELGMATRDDKVVHDDVVGRIAAEGESAPLEGEFLRPLGRGYDQARRDRCDERQAFRFRTDRPSEGGRDPRDVFRSGGQPQCQGEPTDGDGVAFLDGVLLLGVDFDTVDLCSVGAAEVGNAVGAVSPLQSRVVARDQWVAEDNLIVRRPPDGDCLAGEGVFADLIAAADFQDT